MAEIADLPSDGLSLNALTEIAGLLGSHVQFIAWCPSVALVD